MLVLSRKRDEWIDIGPEVSICVVEIRGDKVRLGINAPKDLSVHRREITLAIAKQINDALEADANA
jgi:carbon storage regulator